MTRRSLIVLFLISLVLLLGIAQFQSLPGYMDADYYFGGGIQLAKGNGFTEPYLWNYLNNPQGIPTPSHAYWMPLASLVSALGLLLTGKIAFTSARIGFILLAALVPVLTASLAYRLTSNRTLSFISGLLACFPIYYAPFLPVTDNYAIYMVLGICFFLLLSHLPATGYPYLLFLGFGLTSGLMTLARSDGMLWLGMSFLVVLWKAFRPSTIESNSSPEDGKVFSFPKARKAAAYCFFVLVGFLVILSPWYARNISIYGGLMAPGGSHAIWLRDYNDTFAYPASQLTMERWLASGWDSILGVRLHALGLNLLNAFAAQGGVFLFPFVLVGLWLMRKDFRIRLAILAWLLLLVVMTIVFPFAGARGAFFHSGAALQPVWWAIAPVGLEAVIASVRRRGWFDDRAYFIFRSSLVGIAILMTAVIFITRVLPGWEREDGHYAAVEKLLDELGVDEDAIVIVRNPPGYSIVTGRSAIAIPASGIQSILEVAARYQGRYLILEPEGTSEALRAIYDDPNKYPAFNYLGETDGNRIFEIIQ